MTKRNFDSKIFAVYDADLDEYVNLCMSHDTVLAKRAFYALVSECPYANLKLVHIACINSRTGVILYEDFAVDTVCTSREAVADMSTRINRGEPLAEIIKNG